MPYEVVKDGEMFVCRKQGTTKSLGRHKTKAEAEAQMRALYAGERRAGGKSLDMDEAGELLVFSGGSVKAAGTEGQITGYLVRWGSPELPDRTATKDYFTDQTAFGPFVKGELEGYLHHALPTVKGEPNPVGDASLGLGSIQADGEGLVLSARLDLSIKGVSDIWNEVKADDDAYALSSGAVSHLVRREKQDNGTHWLKRWPIVEWSLTKEPGEPRTAAVALKSLIEDELVAGSSLVGRSERLVAEARELRALFAKALDQRQSAGRSLSPEKLAEIKAVHEEWGQLVVAAGPKSDPERLRALDERLGRLKERIRTGNLP